VARARAGVRPRIVGVTRRLQRGWSGRAGLALLLLAVACTPVATEPAEPTPTGAVVRIGSGPEPEADLLAMILYELAASAGYEPRVVERAGGGAARQALEVGDVDVLPGYTGQAWLEVLGQPNPPGDPRTSYARVASVDGANGIEWLRPEFELEAGVDGPPADATFGLFVRGFPARTADLVTITQLATRLAEDPDAQVCVDEDFAVRPDGWEALASAYSIAPRVLRTARPTEALRGVATGDCLVGLGAATAGEAWAAGLRLLEDPLQVFPAFVVSVQLRDEVAEAESGLVEAFEPLADELTTALLGTWNGQVVRGVPVDEVAAEAARTLRQRAGLVAPAPTPTPTS
jgi:glycine betaine/choline ABC-type transport system substrate-binding protein